MSTRPHPLVTLLTTRAYWVLLVILGVIMEATALYYQYALGDEPCQVCIQIRIWVAAFILLALLMCLLPTQKLLSVGGHLLALACMVGFFERSKFLYDVETGRGNGSCEFFLGFPDWFALDRWLPFLFEVRNLCGFTPNMPWGLTMAESLLALSVALCVTATAALVTNLAVPE